MLIKDALVRMSLVALSVAASINISLIGLTQARAGKSTECSTKGVSFSGITPLHFSSVIGDIHSRLYLDKQYPPHCSQKSKASCKDITILVPGDTVAVGKTCGDFAFVQFIGQQRVSTGWVPANKLAPQSTTPDKPVRPSVANGQYFMEAPRFRLIKGHDTPLCEAYLQRLNATIYAKPPYCDRPENDAIPGFRMLDRIPLTLNEIIAMSAPLYERWIQPNPHLSGPWGLDERTAGGTKAWRYKFPIDLSNDGSPRNVLVWQGYGLSGGPKCGIPANNQRSEVGYRPRQLPLVLKSDNQSIDEEATHEVFAGSGRPNWIVGKDWVAHKGIFPFRPLGRSIGIFEYRGIVYFDTFFDSSGDDKGDRAHRPALANTLAVFLRKNARTLEMCEYEMAGSDYPLDAAED